MREDVQRWACAATPVRYPGDGELLGVVDISGSAGTFNPQSLALAVAISCARVGGSVTCWPHPTPTW